MNHLYKTSEPGTHPQSHIASCLRAFVPSCLSSNRQSAIGNRQSRGSALVAVVAILVIIALMGTTYLITVRTDRDVVFAYGATVSDSGLPTASPANMDAAEAIAQTLVEQALRDALRPSSGQVFRNPAAGASVRADHPNASLFLASRAPQPRANIPGGTGQDNQPGRSYWPYISGPFRHDASNIIPMESPLDLRSSGSYWPAPTPGAYPSPLNADAANRLFDNSGKADRSTLRIGSVTLHYPNTNSVYPTYLRDKTRVFPAFVEDDGDPLYLAADADGNGTADSALFRLNITPDTLSYAGDSLAGHPVTYWAAVRVVDNSANLHLSLAGRAGERDFNNNSANTDSLEWGLYGAFRSHLNLEVLLDPTNGGAAAGEAVSDLDRVQRSRFATLTWPQGGQTPVDDLATGAQRNRTDYRFISQGDAMEHQYARRLENPGVFDSTGRRYVPFAPADQQALAFRDGLVNPALARSQAEQALLSSSLFRAPNFGFSLRGIEKSFGYFPANQEVTWYASTWLDDTGNDAGHTRTAVLRSGIVSYQNNADVPARALRTLTTLSGRTTPTIAPHDMAGVPAANQDDNATPNADLMPTHRIGAGLTANGARRARMVNVNRASFGELWRAYWEVMASDTSSVGEPYPGTETTLFRPGTRHGTQIINSANQMLIRAANAAINTVRFRDPTTTVQAPAMKAIPAVNLTVGGSPLTAVGNVYGIQPQLFLTEVYANTDNETILPGPKRNASGYVAVELYNPFTATINAYQYHILICSRANGVLQVNNTIRFRDLLTSTGGSISSINVNAGARIVIENFRSGATTGTAQYRPQGAGVAGAQDVYYAVNLHQVIGQEMIIVGPWNLAANTAAWLPTDTQFMPIDAFDFTGLTMSAQLADPGAGNPQPTKDVVRWHYARPNGIGADQWKCVYPGRFDPAQAARRQEGTQYREWEVTRLQTAENEPANTDWTVDGWNYNSATVSRPAPALGAAGAQGTYARIYSVQLGNHIATGNFPAPNKIANANGTTVVNQFPFGGFARNGDILNVPFIGASRLSSGGTLYELTPITMAAAFSDDLDDAATGVDNNTIEQLGRFAPLKALDHGYTGTEHYEFASRLFNYLTAVSQPKDDTSPNMENAAYKTSGGFGNNTLPEPVKNTLTGAANANEDTLPVHGLININTAPWQVLAAVPWTRIGDPSITNQTQANDVNRRIAKAIVRYRDVNNGTGSPNGFFRSIFELNRIPAYSAGDLDEAGTTGSPAFRFLAGDPETVDFTQGQGEITAPTSTGTPAGDGILGDYKQRLLVLNRVSNLLTTRSDSFTVYVLVQAWQDAGSRIPVLIGERRSAFIMNRKAPTDNNLYNAAPTDEPIETTGLLAN